MKSLHATVSSTEAPDRRSGQRWLVDILVALGPDRDEGTATIQNLSERGMLLVTHAGLEVGESILVNLPDAGRVEALVEWQLGASFGCSFVNRIPTATISAMLLRAHTEGALGRGTDPELLEFPIAVSPTVDQLSRWKSSFETTKGAEGYRIVAYRQTSSGLVIAIATRAAPS